MWFRHRAWIPIAWVLSLINFAGVWLASRDREPGHGTIQASLAILFFLGAQRLRARRRPELKARLLDRTEQGQTLDDVQACLGEIVPLRRRMCELEGAVDLAERLLAM